MTSDERKLLLQFVWARSRLPLKESDFEDPFKLNDLLTDEERDIQDAARSFSREALMPRVLDAYNNESFDLKIMKEMGEMGFLGCTISDYGLPGLSSTAYGKKPY